MRKRRKSENQNPEAYHHILGSRSFGNEESFAESPIDPFNMDRLQILPLKLKLEQASVIRSQSVRSMLQWNIA